MKILYRFVLKGLKLTTRKLVFLDSMLDQHYSKMMRLLLQVANSSLKIGM